MLFSPCIVYGRQKSTSEIPKPPPLKAPEKLNLTDQYIALLLLVLVDAGLIDVRSCIRWIFIFPLIERWSVL